jgi:hypothetical protein
MTNKTIKIGLPCTPSRILSHEKVETSKVLISYGGGMGGASQKHYCTDVLERDKGMWRLTLLSGEMIEVNPAFIVSVEPRTLVKVVSDTTAHANYHSKVCKERILTEYIGLQFGEDYVITNEYTNREDNRLIKKDELITWL